MTKRIHLRMVTGQNNNKDYIMTDNGDGTFTAEWGRYGAGRMQSKSYSMNLWGKQKNEKLKKGYHDVTEYQVTTVTKQQNKGDFQPIADPAVASTVDRLMSQSKATIAANYEVTANGVTQKQIDDAQEIIDVLSLVRNGYTQKDFNEFNQLLIDLFHIIPRQMRSVQEKLWSDVNDKAEYNRIIQREQDLLDTMAGQVGVIAAQQETLHKEQTLLDAIGIEVFPCNNRELREIQAMMQGNEHRIRNAFSVLHHTQQDRFDIHVKATSDQRTRCLWHGSRTENWIRILAESLKIRPSTAVLTGAMFGNGIYFCFLKHNQT